MRHEVIVGVERRRRWSDDQKVAIVAEAAVPGATVAQVARRHDVSRQHIYQWRRELKAKGLSPAPDGTVFLGLDLVPKPVPEFPSCGQVATAEIGLSNGRSLKLRGTETDEEITRLIRLVETA